MKLAHKPHPTHWVLGCRLAEVERKKIKPEREFVGELIRRIIFDQKDSSSSSPNLCLQVAVSDMLLSHHKCQWTSLNHFELRGN